MQVEIITDFQCMLLLKTYLSPPDVSVAMISKHIYLSAHVNTTLDARPTQLLERAYDRSKHSETLYRSYIV